jgi:hypothetical protein
MSCQNLKRMVLPNILVLFCVRHFIVGRSSYCYEKIKSKIFDKTPVIITGDLKSYERRISWNFWIKYFYLICHVI